MRKLLVPFLLLSAMAFAQQITINGSEHPELIPDEAAASAVFSVHSMFNTPANSANTQKHHEKVGLSEQDRATYYAAMQNFYQMRVAKTPVSTSSVLSELKVSLSPDGYAKLLAFIRSEKRNMQHKTGIGGPQ